MGDYLFDGRGTPDPEIEHLEQLLAPLAYRGEVPLPPRRRSRAPVVAFGAIVAAAAVVAFVALRAPVVPTTHPPTSWPVAWSDGSAGRPSRVRVGDWIETGGARASLRVADIGTIELDAGLRAQIVESGPHEHRLRLDHGALTAKISAPARRFVIETRYVVVTDLGCAFRLAVDTAGRGRVVVLEGAVGVAHRAADAELRVPAGAECAFSEDGAGPVVSSSASPALRRLLERRLDGVALRAALKDPRAVDLPGLKASELFATGDERAALRERIVELEAEVKPTSKRGAAKKRVVPNKLHEPTTTMPQHTPIAPE